MLARMGNYIFLFLFGISSLVARGVEKNSVADKHLDVIMRMIGHEVLLDAGDSISRVMAIEKELNRFKIQFESEFQFIPEELAETIKHIIQEHKIAQSYLVEVENCESQQIIYNFEIGDASQKDLIPCKGRLQPRDCYNLFITILEEGPGRFIPEKESLMADGTSNSGMNPTVMTGVIAALVILLIVFLYQKKRKGTPSNHPDIIDLGSYRFDLRTMTLTCNKVATDLSSKEADLLLLLCKAENTTLERGLILNRVWGDEGDYIGRTLDVFISKLRKKLADDPRIKIINVRGVGYKLVIAPNS